MRVGASSQSSFCFGAGAALMPGRGTAPGEDRLGGLGAGAAEAPGRGTAPGEEGEAPAAPGRGTAPGLTGKMFWQVGHLMRAPPAGIFLSSMFRFALQE